SSTRSANSATAIESRSTPAGPKTVSASASSTSKFICRRASMVNLTTSCDIGGAPLQCTGLLSRLPQRADVAHQFSGRGAGKLGQYADPAGPLVRREARHDLLPEPGLDLWRGVL